jgi:hypothetical protein
MPAARDARQHRRHGQVAAQALAGLIARLVDERLAVPVLAAPEPVERTLGGVDRDADALAVDLDIRLAPLLVLDLKGVLPVGGAAAQIRPPWARNPKAPAFLAASQVGDEIMARKLFKRCGLELAGSHGNTVSLGADENGIRLCRIGDRIGALAAQSRQQASCLAGQGGHFLRRFHSGLPARKFT